MAGRSVIYALEFYWADERDRRTQIARQWQQAKSPEVVEARARAVIKNVLLNGRRSNLCVIKYPNGKTLSVVVGSGATAPRPAARAPARTDPLIPSSA